MLLAPDLIRYPRHLSNDFMAAAIKSCLAQSDEKALVDEKWDLWNFMQRECKRKGIHPALPLLTMQKEQSALACDGKAMSAAGFDHIMGVVGQHTDGTANERWNGIIEQTAMCIRIFAWLTGTGPSIGFNIEAEDLPTTQRWLPGTKRIGVQLLTLGVKDGKQIAIKDKVRDCFDPLTYALWTFTPNADHDIPAVCAKIAEDKVLPFFKE